MTSAGAGIRVAVRVRPGASRTAVGGRYGDRELVVAVTARPVDGAANQAVIRAVADAFGVAARDVEVLQGRQSRSKVLHVAGASDVLGPVLDQLLGS
jgi:uncharacterized protein